jgi:hypothetical protein
MEIKWIADLFVSLNLWLIFGRCTSQHQGKLFAPLLISNIARLGTLGTAGKTRRTCFEENGKNWGKEGKRAPEFLKENGKLVIHALLLLLCASSVALARCAINMRIVY